MSKLEINSYANGALEGGFIYRLRYRDIYCAFKVEEGDSLQRAVPSVAGGLWDDVHPSPVIGDRRYKVARARMRETERIGRGRKRFERIVTGRLMEYGR